MQATLPVLSWRCSRVRDSINGTIERLEQKVVENRAASIVKEEKRRASCAWWAGMDECAGVAVIHGAVGWRRTEGKEDSKTDSGWKEPRGNAKGYPHSKDNNYFVKPRFGVCLILAPSEILGAAGRNGDFKFQNLKG
jgi:hypothetical protein